MQNARDVYETRVEEINIYFEFLFSVIDSRAQLSCELSYSPGEEPQRELRRIQSSVIDTLKANGFLLLYNLVEATVRKALHGIRADIERQGHHYDDLHSKLRKHVADLLKDQMVRTTLCQSTHPVSKAILDAGFDAGRLFGGNIHHETLKSLAKKFGFSVDTDISLTNGGKRLTDVKDRRNQLAHGELSFLECGRDTAIDEILEIKEEVISYLAQILDNIDIYLKSKGYLKTPNDPAIIVVEAIAT
jgi:hypothetical protein